MVTSVKSFMIKFRHTAGPACRIISRALFAKYFHYYHMDKLFTFTRSFITCQDLLSQKKFRLDPTKIVKKDGTVIKKRTVPQPVITVIYDAKEKVLTMRDAHKLAESKGLHLVKIQKPTEKSMDFYELSKVPDSDAKLRNKNSNSECETSEQKVPVKSFIMKTTIADHDLLIKAKGVIKALQKYKVASYIIENKNKEPDKTHELSNKVQQAITNAGISFQVCEEKGRFSYKTYVLKLKNESAVSADIKEVADNKKQESNAS